MHKYGRQTSVPVAVAVVFDVNRAAAAIVVLLGMLSPSWQLSAKEFAAGRPNIIWLSTEDMGLQLGCYGDPIADTPHIDGLAEKGVLYRRAFVPAPVCAPCRSTIITGIYATRLGTSNMRSLVDLPASLRCFPEYLQEQGYYCTNNSKTDYQFPPPPTAWDESSHEAHWRNRPDDDQPFFSVFNFVGTHESRVRGDQPAYGRVVNRLTPERQTNPNHIQPPPYHPDTHPVRADWARYYNTIAALDDWVGGHLRDLREAGLDDNTVVIFWSDHGVGLPRGKRWLYDSGLHVPLIVSVPQRWRAMLPHEPGTSTDELVSLIDLAPAVLQLAGVKVPATMQGRAFLGQQLSQERQYVFAIRDRMDGRYDTIRAVRDKRYKYIRNYRPWRQYAQWINYAERGATMRELRRLRASGELEAPADMFFRTRKPPEELYDTQRDPHELHNLASDAKHRTQLLEMRAALADWMRNRGDLGLLPESELDRLGTMAGSRYGLLEQPGIQEIVRATYEVAELASSPSADSDNQERLIQYARHRAPAVRFWAAHGLAYHGHADVTALRELSILLEDETPCVRLAAAEHLGQTSGDMKAIRVVREGLRNSNRWVRLQAANVLDQIIDEQVIHDAGHLNDVTGLLADQQRIQSNGLRGHLDRYPVEVLTGIIQRRFVSQNAGSTNR